MQSGLLYETGHKKRQLQPLGPSFVIMGSFLGSSPHKQSTNGSVARKHFWEYFTSWDKEVPHRSTVYKISWNAKKNLPIKLFTNMISVRLWKAFRTLTTKNTEKLKSSLFEKIWNWKTTVDLYLVSSQSNNVEISFVSNSAAVSFVSNSAADAGLYNKTTRKQGVGLFCTTERGGGGGYGPVYPTHTCTAQAYTKRHVTFQSCI